MKGKRRKARRNFFHIFSCSPLVIREIVKGFPYKANPISASKYLLESLAVSPSLPAASRAYKFPFSERET
jgi:hypothetical protein